MFHILKIPYQEEAQGIPKSIVDPGRTLQWHLESEPDNAPTTCVCVFFPSSKMRKNQKAKMPISSNTEMLSKVTWLYTNSL